MALSRPVLASRVAGIPELVVEGRTGYMFTPSDWDDLKQKLAMLLDERVRWPRMGRAGRKQVERGFRSDQAAKRKVRLFHGEFHSCRSSIISLPHRTSHHPPAPK